MDTVLAAVPFWMWLLAAAALGAVTVWVYWRCLLADRLSIVETELTARDLALADAQAELDALGGGAALAAAPRAMPDAVDTTGDAVLQAPAPTQAEAGEIETLRYRAWALETRLRSAIDRARSGETIDVTALSRDLEELTDDCAPLEEISALKYRNWLLENRLARAAEAAPEETAEAGALVQPDAAEAEGAPFVERLRDRMARMMTAAKLGNLADIAEIEQEMAADPEGQAPIRIAFDAQPPLGVDLEGDGSADALRYRNWLLATTLKRVTDRLRTGQTIDPDDLETMLRSETRGRFAAEASMELDEDAVDLNSVEMRLDAMRRERDRLADEASGLRYRRWFLSRRLGDVVSGLRDGASVDVDGLETVLRREGESALDNPDAPRPFFLGARQAFRDRAAASAATIGEDRVDEDIDRKAREEAESLRYRLWLVQGELRRLRKRETAVAETPAAALASAPVDGAALAAAQAGAAADRARLWSAEWRAQMMRGRAEAIEARQEERDRAAADIAASLRGRLAQAETALRRLRGEAAAQSVAVVAQPAAPVQDNGEHARLLDLERAALAESRDEAATLRRRLWDVEWAQKERDDVVGRLRDEAAQARARMVSADQRSEEMARRLAEAERALEAARAEARDATQRATVAVAPVDPDPMLAAEVETLRARLRTLEQAESDVAALRRGRDETETLRSRLALSEAENERMRTQLAEAARSLSGAAPEERRPAYEERRPAYLAEPAPARAIAERPVADPRDASRAEWSSDRSAFAAPTAAASGVFHGHDLFAEHLAPAFASPVAGAEAAAEELIERREVIARESNRPGGLLSAPRGEPDDLSLIRGIDARRAADIARLGVFHYSQIAEMGPRDLAWLDDRLGLRGGVIRDRWLPQARMLADWRSAGRLLRDRNGRLYLRAPGERDRLASGAPERAAPAESGFDALRRAALEEADRGWTAHPDAVEVGGPAWGVEMAAQDLLDDSAGEGFARTPVIPAAPEGPADDLTALRGVGPRMAAALAALGLTRFEQIADLGPEAAAWIDHRLGLRGRMLRERWIPQAYGQVERRERAARAARMATRETGGGAGSGSSGGERRAERQDADWVRRERAPRTERERGDLREGGDLRDGEDPREGDDPRDSDEIEAEAERLIRSGDRGRRPGWLDPRGGDEDRDDLTRIEGVGPKMEARMNELGVRRYEHVARCSPEELAWLDSELALGGRSLRERWLSQARSLAGGRWRRRGDRTWTTPSPRREERPAVAETRVETRVEETPEPAPAANAAQAAAVESELTADEIEALELLESGYEPDLTVRPKVLLEAPSRGDKDDLKEIWGIGVKFEELLNDLGVYYFEQLAALTAADLAWVDARLRFRGRAVRDRWIPQARAIVAQRKSESGDS